MKQNILSIDTSLNPAVAAVFSCEGESCTLLESGVFSRATTTEADAPCPSLPELLKTFKSPWGNAVLVMPPRDCISLQLKLPFSDRKNLSRILPGEVQDLLPFEIDQMLLQYRCVGKNGSGYQIHVNAISEEQVKAELDAVRSASVDPAVFCSPASALGLLFQQDAEKSGLRANAVAISAQGGFCSMIFVQDGACVFEHCLLREPDESLESITARAALAIHSSCERLAFRAECIYFCGPEIDAPKLASQTELPVEPLSSPPLASLPEGSLTLAALAAASVRDQNAPVPLSNFRTQKFAYRPHLEELFKGLKTLIPSLIIFLLCGFLTLLCSYYAREILARGMQSSIRSQIQNAVPWLNLTSGRELADLQNEIENLDRQLKDLGSPSKTNPLDALTEISKYLPSNAEITVRVVNIRGTKVTLEGDAPDYAAVDRLEKALKKRKRVFCDVKKSEASGSAYYGASNTRAFSFTLSMCE